MHKVLVLSITLSNTLLSVFLREHERSMKGQVHTFQYVSIKQGFIEERPQQQTTQGHFSFQFLFVGSASFYFGKECKEILSVYDVTAKWKSIYFYIFSIVSFLKIGEQGGEGRHRSWDWRGEEGQNWCLQSSVQDIHASFHNDFCGRVGWSISGMNWNWTDLARLKTFTIPLQITTIILAASENLWGVITGGVIGHAICTGLGVVGGRMIAQKISVRTGKWRQLSPLNSIFTLNFLLVTLVGGVVFIIFAITSSIWDPNAKPETAPWNIFLISKALNEGLNDTITDFGYKYNT